MSTVKVSGIVTAVLRDKSGAEKQRTHKKNLVVQDGLEYLASLTAGSVAAPGFMALGTSAVAAASGDAALGGEVARVAFATRSSSGAVASLTALFGTGVGTATIEEAGIFAVSSSGIMLARFLTGTFHKATNDTLEITWELTFAS